jgi:hypothetical protein
MRRKHTGKNKTTRAKRQRSNGKRHPRTTPKRRTIPRTAEQYFAMSALAQDEWNRVGHVISKMETDGISLPKASREFGLDPSKVVRLSGSALRKLANGRYAVKANNSLLRVLVLPTPEGLKEIAVRGSKEASLIGRYWAAVQKYLETGDASALQKIRRNTITDADGKRIRLIKDLTELERLGSAGVLSFESLYAKAA